MRLRDKVAAVSIVSLIAFQFSSAFAFQDDSRGNKFGRSISAEQYSDFVQNLVHRLASAPKDAKILAGECTPTTSPISGGGFNSTGNADISNDQSNLNINIVADAGSGWFIQDLQVYAGSNPVPLTPTGAADISQFPVKDNFSTPQSAYAYSLPLSTFGASCGGSINVAIHATMVQIVNGIKVAEEDSWVVGFNLFPDGPGSYLNYTICCSAPVEYGCTRPALYWASHHKFAIRQKNRIPWPISENTALCGKSWLTHILSRDDDNNVWDVLAKQWISAKLNLASNASSTTVVDATLAAAQTMLTSNCRGISRANRRTALEKAMVLRSYNKGDTGPGLCSDAGENKVDQPEL